jgi:hypothetical protein
MKRGGMNDTKNETVRFNMKPNPFLYALEFTRHILLQVTIIAVCAGIPFIPFIFLSSVKGALLLLMTYALLGLPLFIVAYVAACNLTFVLTDNRAIVRYSFRGTTTDGLSIAIESVKQIAITSFGATYGSVFLSYDKTSPRKDSKDSERDYPQPRPILRVRNEAIRASIPIKRATAFSVEMSGPWPRLLGFYGFKGFEEFANIISEQQNSVLNVTGDHGAG